MAYGRLDVLFPDGNFRSFPLLNPTESVGRSPGNTISLEADTISRYHISLTHDEGAVHLSDMDSQNGTYVDGVKVPKGGTVELRGGEEILIGELRLIYHELDELPTQPIEDLLDKTTELIDRDAPFYLSLQPPPISIPPGAHASAELSIANATDEKGYYSVGVSGVPRSWVRLDRPKVLLEPHESGQVVINIRPDRQPETTPGDYTITVNVRTEGSGEYIAEASTRIHILPYGGFGMALEQEVIEANERFRLHLHNQGSAPLPLKISGGTDRTKNVQVSFVSSAQVTLEAGQRLVIQGTAQPSERPLLGKPKTLPFDIMVRSEQPNQFVAVVEGEVIRRALMPSWVPYAVGGLLVGLLAVLALGVLVLGQPTPTVTDFAVTPLSVARGEAVDLQWQAEDVTDLSLLLDETPVAWLTPEAESFTYTLDPAIVTGESAVLSLRGSAGRRLADPVSQRLQVYDAMYVERFSFQPDPIIANVVTRIDVSWDIPNAEFVQVGGLEAFAASGSDYNPTARYEPTGSLAGLTGIARGGLQIELYAEDDLGNVFTFIETVTVDPAQCAPLAPPLELREGPNPLNTVIGTIQESQAVTVVGRDTQGAWLAVETSPASDVVGWAPLSAFDCANTFNPADLAVIVDVPPPPVPTATPTLTPTPTTPPTRTPPPPTESPTPPQAGQRTGPGEISTTPRPSS